MSQDLKEMDSHKSWLYAKNHLECEEKKGNLTRERTFQLLKDAKENYSNNSYNKEMEKLRNGKN